MSGTDKERCATIRELNDAFRRSFRGGRVMLTQGVQALSEPARAELFKKVQAFEAFDEGNDPWQEHDFVSVEHEGQTYFAKIDYYDRAQRYGSEDPSDPAKTVRIMTIMLAEEY